MLLDILFPLAITLLVEPIATAFMNRLDKRVFIASFGANLLLNPLMNILLLSYAEIHYWVFLGIFECVSVLVESIVLASIGKVSVKKALLFAFIANLLSFGVGLLLNPIVMKRGVELTLTIVFLAIDTLLLGLFLALSFLKARDQKDKSDDHARD